MTFEEICECQDPEVLAKLTDEQLEAIFKPFFPSCRPEMIVRKNEQPLSPGKLRAMELLSSQGIDVSFMKRKRK